MAGDPLTRERALLPARALAALANFQALIDDLDQSSETLPLDELTEHAIDVTGCLISPLRKGGGAKPE